MSQSKIPIKFSLRQNNNTPKKEFKKTLFQWAEVVSSTGSIHGISWFNYFQKDFLKGLVSIFTLCMFICLPALIYLKGVDFFLDTSIRSATKITELDSAVYPQIIVCHPFFFDLEKIQSNKSQTLFISAIILLSYFSDTLGLSSMDEINDFTSILTFSMNLDKIGEIYKPMSFPNSNRNINDLLPWFENKLTHLLSVLEIKNVQELMEIIAVE